LRSKGIILIDLNIADKFSLSVFWKLLAARFSS
jgi:hypothetical protein